jgi:hypothetical protein
MFGWGTLNREDASLKVPLFKKKQRLSAKGIHFFFVAKTKFQPKAITLGLIEGLMKNADPV